MSDIDDSDAQDSTPVGQVDALVGAAVSASVLVVIAMSFVFVVWTYALVMVDGPLASTTDHPVYMDFTGVLFVASSVSMILTIWTTPKKLLSKIFNSVVPVMAMFIGIAMLVL